jgi:hypothetical protein
MKSLRLPDLRREIILHPMAASIPPLALRALHMVPLSMLMVCCWQFSLKLRQVIVLKMSVAACLFTQEIVCLILLSLHLSDISSLFIYEVI